MFSRQLKVECDVLQVSCLFITPVDKLICIHCVSSSFAVDRRMLCCCFHADCSLYLGGWMCRDSHRPGQLGNLGGQEKFGNVGNGEGTMTRIFRIMRLLL